MTSYTVIAFVSGIVVEALYALGVMLIGRNRVFLASYSSVLWGAAFLVGVNESFRTKLAAAAWCLGLGIGTAVGIAIGGRSE